MGRRPDFGRTRVDLNAALQRDLVDEMRLLVAPLLLGEGVPLFGAVTERRALKLVASQAFDMRSVLLSYRSA